MDKIRIMIADDHNEFRNSLIEVFQHDKNLELIAEATNGRDAGELTIKLKPDVLLLDIEMADIDGIEVSRYVKKYSPKTKVLIISNYRYHHYVRACIDVKVNGYLLKNVTASNVIRTIHLVCDGLGVYELDCIQKLFTKTNNP